MNTAHIVVLSIAPGAGGSAAHLAGEPDAALFQTAGRTFVRDIEKRRTALCGSACVNAPDQNSDNAFGLGNSDANIARHGIPGATAAQQ